MFFQHLYEQKQNEPPTPEQWIAEAKALRHLSKRKWSDIDKLGVMASIWEDGGHANYGVKCSVCQNFWLQYEYANKPFDMEAYCWHCRSGMRQGKGLKRES